MVSGPFTTTSPPRRASFFERHAFGGEDAALGPYAAVRRETARSALRGEDAMARHDDRERVSSESLPDGARRAWRADAHRELTVEIGRASCRERVFLTV